MSKRRHYRLGESRNTDFDRCLKALQLTAALASQAHATWVEVGHFIARNDSRFSITVYLTRSSFLTMIIELYKPLDTNWRSYTFRSLQRHATAQGIDIDSAKVNMLVSKMIPLWEKVKLLRHKFYGHLDSSETITGLLLKTGNNAEDFEKLLELYETCLSTVLKKIGVRLRPFAEANEQIKAELKTGIQAIASAAGYPYF